METEIDLGFRKKHKKKKSKRTLLIVLGAVFLALGVAAFFGYRYVNRILKRPETMFRAEETTPIPEAMPIAPAFSITIENTAESRYNDEPADQPLPSEPAAEPTQVPVIEEKGESKGTVNIMLMGIDAYEDGRTTSGSMPHTDAMMVIAVNFDEDTVDIITLPRDTFTTVPGYSGFYKLNGVFNVGLNGKFKTTGKADDLAEGFKLVCRTAEKWLGGISIPYYYGVDFQAVVDIVDAIGGIDYDVDEPFRAMNTGRSYHVGMQHLDGNAVMGYLRIRQSADGLDSSRTARQRKMLVAIFNKLKKEGKLSQIPTLILAANSGIYTNATLGQTAALVNYASNLSTDQIRTRAMYGEISTIEVYWRFAYVDQQNRIDLIRDVYGIEAKPVGICTRQYERWLNRIGFLMTKHLHQIEKLLVDVQEKKDAGTVFSDEQIALYAACYNDYLALHRAFERDANMLADIYGVTPWREKKESRGQWSEREIAEDADLLKIEDETVSHLTSLSEKARVSAKELADAVRYKGLSWSIKERWYYDTDINEVYVNFG